MENNPVLITPPVPKKNTFPLGSLLFFLGVLVGYLASSFMPWPFFSKVNTTQTQEPANFKECVESPGSNISESYPSVCFTKSGVGFKEILLEEETNTLILTEGQVVGIQTNTCCSCPTVISSSEIGSDGWILYETDKNYSSLLPDECKRADCAPCPPLKIKK